jgi:hypothetical protein
MIIRLAFAFLLAAAAFTIAAEILVHHATPILKGRILETLSTRFNARVELDEVDVSVFRGLQVSGHGLRIFAPNDIVFAGTTRPLFSVRQFSFHANLRGLFLKPTHAGTVYVSGLEIHIPPHQLRQATQPTPARKRGRMEVTVDHFLCEDSALILENGNPDREPKRFQLQRIELWEIGPNAPWRYDATLVNAVPRGNIHAIGAFGPWNTETPGDSSVTGHYTFDHADLDPIKGIGGTLSSVGDFTGQLDRISVIGTTDTPDFSLDSAQQPMPLRTRFNAIVDGTTGDTWLTSVDARLRNTPILCRGSVVNLRGQGHVIDLDVDIPNGYLQDLLALTIRTRPVYLTSRLDMKARLHIPPGKQSVSRKLAVRGAFTLHAMRFTNPDLQQKVDELSLRAQARPAQARPGAPLVPSRMTGTFSLDHARIDFGQLLYTLPGAAVDLTGIYSLDGEQFDFRGNVRTVARLSQMVSKWWQQLLLKPIDPFFRKNGAGTQVPIRISGTHNKPKFGLDFHDKDSPAKDPLRPFHPTLNRQF